MIGLESHFSLPTKRLGGIEKRIGFLEPLENSLVSFTLLPPSLCDCSYLVYILHTLVNYLVFDLLVLEN